MRFPRFRVLTHNQMSKGARALAEALNGLVLRRENSTYRPYGDGSRDIIVNWGVRTPTDLVGQVGAFYNLPEQIEAASNKLKFFRMMQFPNPELIPRFWTTAIDIPKGSMPVVVRTVLSGHSGEGIVIANKRSELVPAPLYVKYIKKRSEYRVHVGKTEDAYKVISIQRKARRPDVPVEDVNWMVRNHQNGFIYVRNDVKPPYLVIEAAKRALAVTGLHFGAVDVIWNEHMNRAFVLEVNTAPGIEGQTVADYAAFFRRDNW